MAKPLWEGYSWIFISARIIPAFAPLAALPESPTGFRAVGAQSTFLGILRMGCSSSTFSTRLRIREKKGNTCGGRGDEIPPGKNKGCDGMSSARSQHPNPLPAASLELLQGWQIQGNVKLDPCWAAQIPGFAICSPENPTVLQGCQWSCFPEGQDMEEPGNLLQWK